MEDFRVKTATESKQQGKTRSKEFRAGLEEP